MSRLAHFLHLNALSSNSASVQLGPYLDQMLLIPPGSAPPSALPLGPSTQLQARYQPRTLIQGSGRDGPLSMCTLWAGAGLGCGHLGAPGPSPAGPPLREARLAPGQARGASEPFPQEGVWISCGIPGMFSVAPVHPRGAIPGEPSFLSRDHSFPGELPFQTTRPGFTKRARLLDSGALPPGTRQQKWKEGSPAVQVPPSCTQRSRRKDRERHIVVLTFSTTPM